MPTLTRSDDLSIFYQTYGTEQQNPSIVFLNGMTQTTRHWVTHGRDLKDDFHVVTYDARGQGRSDIPDEAPSLDDHVRDLTALLDHLEIDRAHLVGFSHGARIALSFAADVADRIDHLVLTSATATPTARARLIVRAWGEILDSGGLEALAWASLSDIVGNRFLENNEAIIDNIIRASVDRNTEEGTRRLLEGLQQFDPLDDIARRVEAPTRVLAATDDPLVTPDGAAELAELCGGTHELVEDCGHTIPIERPDDFQRLVREFLPST